MDVNIFSYSQGDPLLIDKIVNEFLSQGKFDKLRKECMSDADTKPAYQNLQQRVETTVTQFLKKQIWKPDLNKNQLRDSLKKHVLESNFFDAGINRIVDQVVNPNVLATVFLPEVEEVVYNYLSIPKPLDKTPKKGFNTVEAEKFKPLGNDRDNKFVHYKEKKIDSNKNKEVIQKLQNEVSEMTHLKDNTFSIKKENLHEGSSTDECSVENTVNSNERLKLQNVKLEDKIIEAKDIEIGVQQIKNSSVPSQKNAEKFEFPSDESQEATPRLAIERLQINETKLVCPADSTDSCAFELIEKAMSESRDSEDSIMNQMSPISQGRLTPDIFEDENIDEKKEKYQNEGKKPLTFIGRIPKLKREDSELSKTLKKVLKTDKSDLKIIYSSDESDSSKSYEKSDYEGKNNKDKKLFDDKRYKTKKGSGKSNCEMKIKDEERLKTSKDRKSLNNNDRGKKKEKNESRSHRVLKDSSSYSGDKGHHKSSHASQQKNSYFKESIHDKKKKEQKKKNKSSDDHEKEKIKKNDRRSTDRDSNERDKSSGSRNQSDGKKIEREQKTEETKGEKSHKEGAEMDNEIQNRSESDGVVLEMEGDWMTEEEIVLVNEEWVCSKIFQGTETEVLLSNKIITNTPRDAEHIVEENESLNFERLIQTGELALIKFSEPTNDFYVKFNSTGFKYFEEWEKCKLDCEEEFKEFVDEAENNLSLISDDDSEFEELNFDEKNQNIIENLLKGISNYKKGLMFNPLTSEFYKWTSSKYYHKFRKKFEKKCWKNSQKNESDESIKENINRSSKKSQNSVYSRERTKEGQVKDEKYLHLKLLNRYKRKALRQGKHRRKYKKKTLSDSSKEKTLNSNESTLTMKNGFLLKSEVEGKNETQDSFLEFDHSNMMAMGKRQLYNQICEHKEINMNNTILPQKCHLPLSPESDDCSPVRNGVTEADNKSKKPVKFENGEHDAVPRKKSRRHNCQKYENQDLYKPRLVLNSNRARVRGDRGLENNTLCLNSLISISSGEKL